MSGETKLREEARQKRLTPIFDYSPSPGYRVQVFLLHPGDVMPGFGGSRTGLQVGKTPSLVTREISSMGQIDTERDTYDLKAWESIRKGIEAAAKRE